MALPLPKVIPDVGPGGGVVTAMRGTNALTSDMLDNVIKEVQARYAPASEQSKIASQYAYAKYRPAEIAGTFLSSPNLRTMNQAQQNALAEVYANNLTNPQLQMPPGMPQEPQKGGGLINMLKNALVARMGGQQSPTQQPVNPMSGGMVPPGMPRMPQPGAQPQNPMAAPPQTPGYTTPAMQQNTGMVVPGSNPVSPVDAANTIAESSKQAALGQTANENAGWNEVEKNATAVSTSAVPLMKNIEGFHNAYKKSKYTGQYLGTRPTSGEGSIPTLPGHNNDPEQLAGRFANNMATDMAAIISKGGAQTDSFRDMVSSLKLGLDLNKGSEQVMYDASKSTAERMAQTNDFYNYFRRKNPGASYKDAVAMFGKYNQYAPPFNYETFKTNKGANDRMTEFASPEALKTYQETGNYTGREAKPKAAQASENKAPKSAIDTSTFTDADLKATAKKYGMTVDEVKNYFGMK